MKIGQYLQSYHKNIRVSFFYGPQCIFQLYMNLSYAPSIDGQLALWYPPISSFNLIILYLFCFLLLVNKTCLFVVVICIVLMNAVTQW